MSEGMPFWAACSLTALGGLAGFGIGHEWKTEQHRFYAPVLDESVSRQPFRTLQCGGMKYWSGDLSRGCLVPPTELPLGEQADTCAQPNAPKDCPR